MNVETLISEVFMRPSLWNKNEKNHHNRFVLDKLWKEVALKTQTSPTAVRKKWKCLRDKFRTTLACIQKSKSGDVRLSDYQGEWRYFQRLLFLKDQFNSRHSIESYGDTVYDDNDVDEAVQDDASAFTGEENKGSVGDASLYRSFTSTLEPPKSLRQSVGNALIEIERQKLQYLQGKRQKTEEDDEDLSFFKSLLPHVRTLSAYEKLEYRMKVMRITQEFIKPKTSTFSSPLPDNIVT